MFDVLFKATRCPDVDAEIGTARTQHRRDGRENTVGVSLVVDGVERGDEIEAGRPTQAGGAPDLELGVLRASRRALRSRCGNALFGEVVADEAAAWGPLGHDVDRVPGSTPDVGGVG